MLSKYICITFISISMLACRKADFLNTKPDQSQSVPSSIKDLQALLDNDQVMNGTGNFGVVPAFGEMGSDNYYVSDDLLASYVDPLGRNAYRWEKNLYAGEEIKDWDFPYRSIFYSNEVLEGIKKLNPSEDQLPAWNNAKGSALFYRAHMLYQLAQVFAAPYDSSNANNFPGLPLRVAADINEKIQRASLQQTYDRITTDLLESVSLLPATALYKTRPSKPAAYALLARVYQTMQLYDKALLYADSCLQLQNTLLDYNSIDSNANLPFQRFNTEVIFHSVIITSDIIIVNALASVDSNLYNAYQPGDLRKSIYYVDGNKGGSLASGKIFKGSYDGSAFYFAGLATDEMYLIRAECEARKGITLAAMNDLNTLLINRWSSGTFIPLTATNAADALTKVLRERRKELIFRATRWTDLRRLNKYPNFAVTLTRLLKGQPYTLPANDNRYVYPIPPSVIAFNPSMVQNPR